MRISDWSSDVCSSDLRRHQDRGQGAVDAAWRAPRRSRGEGRGRRPAGGDEPLPEDRVRAPEPRDRLDGRQHPRDQFQEAEQDLSVAENSKPAAGTGRAAENTAPYGRSEEHTSDLQSLMRISYAVFRLKNKTLVVSI